MTLLLALACVSLLAGARVFHHNLRVSILLAAAAVASAILCREADLIVLAVIAGVVIVTAGTLRVQMLRSGAGSLGTALVVAASLVAFSPQVEGVTETIDAATARRVEWRALYEAQEKLRTTGAELPDRECLNVQDSEQCYRTLFVKRAEKSSAIAQAVNLSRIVEAYPNSDVVGHCHVTNHDLGGMALRETNGTPMEVFEKFPPQYMSSCSWGFSHGVWQQWFDNMTTEELIGGIGNLCLDNSVAGSLARVACTHILGHTVVQRVPEKYLTNLMKCKLMPDSEDYTLCINGGLMEHFGSTQLRIAVEGKGEKYALAPCGEIEEPYLRKSCFSEAGPQLGAAMSYDPKGMFEACEAQAGVDKESCFQGAIRGGILLVTEGQVDRVIKACRSAGERFYEPCIRNSALMLAFNSVNRVTADQICATLPESQREECSEFALAGVTLSQRSPT